MTDQTYRATLAKLTANVALMQAEVRADPLPFLQRAAREMGALHQVLMEIETALNDTNWVFDQAAAANIPPDLYKADHARLTKARAALTRWMTGREA